MDRLVGGTDRDLLYGGADADVLFGGLDGDSLYGGNGNDTVYGADGNDTIYFDNGDDMIYGGNGFDQYHLGRRTENSHDTVFGFNALTGSLHLSSFTITTFEKLVENALQSGNDLILLLGTSTVQLNNTTINDLDAGNVFFL